MQLSARHFAVALPLAFTLHGMIAAAIFWAPESPGARGPGMGGIEVSLGPAGAAPGDIAPVVPEAREVAPEETRPEEIVAVDAEEAMQPPDAMALEATAREILPEDTAIARAPAPPPKKRETARKTATTPPAVRGAGGRTGQESRGDAGSGSSRSGGGNPGAADYTARLLAWLQRHKRYPREAMARRDQGTALLYFEIGPRGQVLSYRLRRSSGHKALDSEALALIRRAQPLPAPPPQLAGSRLRLVVPVRFSLR